MFIKSVFKDTVKKLNNKYQDKVITEDDMEELYSKISDGTFNDFFLSDNIEKITLDSGREVYKCKEGSYELELYLMWLSNVLKKVIKVKMPNRNVMIEAILQQLSIDSRIKTHEILRIDIKQFYNSIDINRLERQILDKNQIYQIEIIRILQSFLNLTDCLGLPQGLAPSNVLAEIYGAEIDTEIKKIISKNGIKKYMYYRYVDDIIIIYQNSDNNIAPNIKMEIEFNEVLVNLDDSIKHMLKDTFKLELNDDKGKK